jgi:hypothetical protein
VHLSMRSSCCALRRVWTPLLFVALRLTHESVETAVRIYLVETLAMKELGLAKSSPSYGGPSRCAPGDLLLSFLDSLLRREDYVGWLVGLYARRPIIYGNNCRSGPQYPT